MKINGWITGWRFGVHKFVWIWQCVYFCLLLLCCSVTFTRIFFGIPQGSSHIPHWHRQWTKLKLKFAMSHFIKKSKSEVVIGYMASNPETNINAASPKSVSCFVFNCIRFWRILFHSSSCLDLIWVFHAFSVLFTSHCSQTDSTKN